MKKIKIILEPGPGSTLYPCKIEAMKCSLEYKTDVEFTFNGAIYLVSFEELINIVGTK